MSLRSKVCRINDVRTVTEPGASFSLVLCFLGFGAGAAALCTAFCAVVSSSLRLLFRRLSLAAIRARLLRWLFHIFHVLDNEKLHAILSRYNLEGRWRQFEQRYLRDTQ